MVEEINAGRPQCPVGLMTLVLPSKGTLELSDKQPYVYLQCGHVHGQHQWGHKENDSRTCPLCIKVNNLRVHPEISKFLDIAFSLPHLSQTAFRIFF